MKDSAYHSKEKPTIKNENFYFHFIQLRRMILKSLILMLVLFCVFLYFSDSVFYYFAKPLLDFLPFKQNMIATSISSPLIIPLKLSFYLALLISMPYILKLCWQFIAPALYQNENTSTDSFVRLTFMFRYRSDCGG